MKRKQFQYSYILLLGISFLAAGAGWIIQTAGLGENSALSEAAVFAWKMQGVPVYAEEGRPETEEQVSEEEVPKALPEDLEETKTEEEEAPALVPVWCEADISWFDDALFIGDSRTVGLHEYGNLGNAEVVADSGMSVYKVYGKEFETSSGEKKLLQDVLEERQFGKVYVMLGINELGYAYEQTVQRYTELIKWIQELQPETLIFLQANLHITGRKSETSDIYNNENINRFNEAVKELSDGNTRFYLDVNELFDDEDGNLSTDYTVDNAHVLGKYYSDWVEWLLGHAVTFQPEGGEYTAF